MKITVKQIIGYVFFGLLSLAALMSLIGSLVGIGDLTNIGSYGSELATYVIILWVINLLVSLTLCGLAIVGVVAIVKNKGKLEKLGAFTYAIYAAWNVISVLFTVIYFSVKGGSFYSVSAESIVSLVFLILGIIAIVVGLVSNAKNELIAKVLMVIGLFLVFVAVIVSLAASGSNLGALSIVVNVFVLIDLLVGMAYVFIPENLQLPSGKKSE